ncbi:MAG: hypothetical protein IKE43_02605 [Coriobacteriales bacterium]|nr:hypothetical protein [Coriobacteriales bacterium]
MADAQVGIDVKGLKEQHIPAKLTGEGHDVSFDIDGIPEKLYVGDTASLVLFGACQSGCELVGDAITVLDFFDNIIAQTTFKTQEGELAVSGAMNIAMPQEPGKIQYIIHYEPRELPKPDDGGPAFKNPHEPTDLLIEFTVEPHHIAISTWGVTTPVYTNEPIQICVGASCSSGCRLAGQKVEIYTEDNVLMCSGTLHEPVEPRKTLWWDELHAVAPSEAKLHRWEARFVAEGLERPHEEAKHKFSFVARVRPERNFKITVIDDKTKKPQRSARVELKLVDDSSKSQFASTGAEGTAEIGVTKGKYTLKVTAPSRKAYNEVIDLTEHDVEVEIDLLPTGVTDDQHPMRIIDANTKSAAAEAQPEAEE